MSTRPFPKLRPTVGDVLVGGAVLLLAVLCGLWLRGGGEDGRTLSAVVSIDGAEADRFLLVKEEERIYKSRGYTLHIRVEKSGTGFSVAVTDSDCPGKDCVHTGAISRVGQSVVCLPARLSIQLTGTQDGSVDAVIG